MELISSDDYHQLISDPEVAVLHSDGDKPKVLLKEQIILKIFRPKSKLISSSYWRPMALRFSRHSKILNSLGYLVPDVTRIQHCQEMNIYLLHYPRIAGETVQQLVLRGELSLLNKMAVFMAGMHRDGIFFRSAHLENFLYTEEEKFALIDLADMKFKSSPLTAYSRYRNLRHLFEASRDQPVWHQFGKPLFLSIYLHHADLPFSSKNFLRYLLRHIVHQ